MCGRLAVLALMAMAGGAAAQQTTSFPADAAGYVTFALPSGNIGCVYTPAGGSKVYKTEDNTAELSCDRSEPKYIRVTMRERSKVYVDRNVADPSCCGVEHILPYGGSWRGGPFTCTSAQTGLTCKRDDGRGFTMSRAGVKPF